MDILDLIGSVFEGFPTSFYNLIISHFRYLFVNSRAWPENYKIEDPFEPPSISEDITVHVIDLVKMQNLGVMYKGHKGYSPNRGCFFIYLDVHDDYVARYQRYR